MRFYLVLMALLVGTSLLGTSVLAQKATVFSEFREIEGLRRQGQGVLVEYEKKTVEKAWNKFLKTIGKPEAWKGGTTVVLEASVTNPDYAGADHITRLDATAEGTKVFWSIGAKGEYAQPGTQLHDKAKKALQDFARQLYRDDLTEQIEAAEKMAEVASRTHDKTAQMGENLRKQQERNTQEQASLLKAQEEKKTDAERIKQELVQNKLDQESALEEIKKIRKIAEERKRKLTTE